MRCVLQEIWTGKAFAKAKAAAVDMYSQGHSAAQPHVQKAWAAVEPTCTRVSEQIKLYWNKLQVELNKEPYKPYVDKVREAGKVVYDFALGLRASAIDLWNSDEVRNGTSWMLHVMCWWMPMVCMLTEARDVQVNKAKAFVMKQKDSLERDLGNLYTHALGADVPGSGIDDCCIHSLVRFTLYSIPAMLFGIPLLCMRRGGKKKGGRASVPTASPASSKTNKRTRKK